MLLLTEAELRESVDPAAAVEAVAAAFVALADGKARLPDPVSLEIPEAEGEVHVKGAHIAGDPTFAFKVATGFWRNPERGLPSGAGLMLAFDAETGVPRALLLDNAWLTDLRTGAAGAVAARHLARRELARVGVLGAGVQARHQVRCLTTVRRFPRLAVWSRDAGRSQVYAEEMERELDIEIEVAATAEAAVRGSDLVVTATPSRQPLVAPEWLSPGVHITAVGSDAADKQELDVGVLALADLLVVDRLSQCRRLGELHHALASGALGLDDVDAELGEVVAGRHAGRTDDRQISVCDLTGVGVQDTAIARLALEGAEASGLGRVL